MAFLNTIKNATLLFVFVLSISRLYAQKNDTIPALSPAQTQELMQFCKINDTVSYGYPKPKAFEFITRIPDDFGFMASRFVQTDNLIWFGASVGTTAALIPLDQKTVDNSRSFGQRIGFHSAHTFSGPIKMFPTNINSAIFRFGNGFTALLVGGGLLTYGLVNKNYRAVHTASELAEGLIASGLLVQPLKRITGRESPFIAEEKGNPGGEWHFFPSFAAFQKRTPNYDAMPSGHLTTLMTTFMIISENYKEVKWIKPAGVGLMGLMGYEMLQSKVHWASDYPLALFMGYIIGKSIVKARITEQTTTTAVGILEHVKPKFNYSFSSNAYYSMVGATMVF